MVNKGLCFVGCIVHFFLVATLLVWVAVFNKCNMSSKAWVLVMDVLFIICSITIGKVLLKLDIDKLFMKFEVEGINGMNKVFFFAALITAILIVGFAILMVLIVGVQWLFANPQKRAELKGKLVNVFVGVGLILGAVTILTILENIFS